MKTILCKLFLTVGVIAVLLTDPCFAETPAKNTIKSMPTKNTVKLQREVKKSDISSLAKPESSETKDSLAELISQIESLEIPDTKTDVKQPLSQPSATQEQPGKKEEVKAEPLVKTSETTEATETSTPKKKDTIELINESKNITEPLAVAESLLACGKSDKAIKFFDMALEATNGIETMSDTNRAWILFQLATCLRGTEPARAGQLYQQLIAEYPESYWTPVAAIQNQIVEWQLKAQPKTVLEKHQSDPNSL